MTLTLCRACARSSARRAHASDGGGSRVLGVRPEQVGSLVEAGDRGLAAEGAVWSLMVVVVQPAVKGGGAFGAVAIERAVGPAAEHGADQALGFAIGLGSV